MYKVSIFLYLREVVHCRGCPMCPRSTLPSRHPLARGLSSCRLGYPTTACGLSSTGRGMYIFCFWFLLPCGWRWSRNLWWDAYWLVLITDLLMMGGTVCLCCWLFGLSLQPLQSTGCLWGQILVLMSQVRFQPSDKSSLICLPPALYLKRESQSPPRQWDPPRPAGRSGSGSHEVTASALDPRVYVLPSPVELLRSISTDLQSKCSGDSQARKPDVGLSPVGELLWYNYSTVCGLPTWWLWDLIISWVHPSYHLIVISSLSFNIEYLFW